MLIDNKTKFKNDVPKSLSKYLETNLRHGKFDAVTGYFTVDFLARMSRNMNSPEQFRLVLGNLVSDDSSLEDYTIDLLQESLDVSHVLKRSSNAKKAIEFLEQEKVEIKTVDKNFCHAKMYLYNDLKESLYSFYSVGSSNMTEAGMGVRKSGNVELNELQRSETADFENAQSWFESLWEYIASSKIKHKSVQRDFKDHVIELISQLYKKYTPEELYHKILFELFKKDIIDFEEDSESQQNLEHLKKTRLWDILYGFQKKGVLSLIKMLQKFNGAILADAVGLGKTWQALAVMKYFEMKGYQVLVLCPKKLSENWEKYRDVNDSLFKQDRLRYLVRYHTDLQYNETEEYRLEHPTEVHTTRFDNERYKDNPLSHFQHNPKMLLVIDESHNLRNDKSSRYQFLVDNILKKNEDVIVLQLSATPINNELKDIRNQFKLMVKGSNDGFLDTPLAIRNLENEFRTAERAHTKWKEKEDGTLSELVQKLPDSFTQLTDKLIVARTRKLILDYIDGDLEFPDKEKPKNVFKNPQGFGELKEFDHVLEILENLNLTAYRPAAYIPQKKVSVLKDEQQRQRFLVKMMFILLIKRLESSWMSFKKTLEKILDHHVNALDKIERFEKSGEDVEAGSNAENMEDQDEDNGLEELTLGKKNPVKLSDIEDIEKFKKDVKNDIERLQKLKKNIDAFETSYKEQEVKDEKLDALREIIRDKQEQPNKKLVIFTTYTDTATYLFDQLKDEFEGVGLVTGSEARSNTGLSFGRFEPLLDYFAPYTKLYKERHWNDLYVKEGIDEFPDYRGWKQLMKVHRPDVYKKLEEPINILIATDCLSEGQNLQDCDCVVNYDIHWNPVRLVQRFGRIDRIGSPNDTITGVNFWPAANYESLLDLKGRVEKRMAIMILGGAEIVETSPEVTEKVKENPLIDQQTEKMLRQLQTSWEDVESEEDTFGLDDLSLEQFRQELLSVLLQNREKYESMPNGIFSGFKIKEDLFDNSKEGMIGLLGYPKRNPNNLDHVYSEHHLFYAAPDEPMVLINRQDILSLLRQHKKNERIVPQEVEKGDEEMLNYYSNLVDNFLKAQTKKDTEDNLEDIFKGKLFDKPNEERRSESRKEEFIEDHFNTENFDLICWLTLTK